MALPKEIRDVIRAQREAKAQEYRNNFSTNYNRLTASDIEEEEEKKKMGMKHGGKVSSASKRADGVAIKGKTRGKMV